MQAEKIIKSKRKFQGTVVGDKMDKTISVLINLVKINEKYGKRFAFSKRYKVHDEKNAAKVGDIVEFEECRPLSKEKRWRLIKIVS